MMFVSSAGLDKAKQLVSAYKQNHVPAMTSELWHAKKVVDSTLHPGSYTSSPFPFLRSHSTDRSRHRRAGLPPLPHVQLCPVQLGRHCGYAYARSSGAFTLCHLMLAHPRLLTHRDAIV